MKFSNLQSKEWRMWASTDWGTVFPDEEDRLEAYNDMAEANGLEFKTEEDDEVMEYIQDLTYDYWEGMFEGALNLKNVVVTGYFGAWNGRRNIVPCRCKDLKEAIDKCSSTSSRWDVISYWGSLALAWLVASVLSIPFTLNPYADINSVQWATVLSIAAIKGFSITGIGYLIHNWTHWLRKKTVLASERVEELHSAILECRNVKAWSPSVQQIFGDIEKFNDLASGDSLSQLKIHNTKQAQQIDLLSKELEAAQKQINTYKTNATSLLGDLFIESEDKSFKIPVSFFKHAIFQTGEPGFSDSIALPILILTAWSLRAQPPLPKEKISTVIRQRVKSNAEIVRNLCKDLPQYRGKITKNAQWKTYVSSLETPILKILVPMSDDGKSISGSGYFESRFEYLAKARPLPEFLGSADRLHDTCMTED